MHARKRLAQRTPSVRGFSPSFVTTSRWELGPGLWFAMFWDAATIALFLGRGPTTAALLPSAWSPPWSESIIFVQKLLVPRQGR